MSEHTRVIAVAEALADGISRRDAPAVAEHLAAEFRLRTPGRATTTRQAFLDGIARLPKGIEFVKLRELEVDIDGDHALATGLQHARVRIGGEVIDEVRPFVDWFARTPDGRWQVRAALDLPALSDVDG